MNDVTVDRHISGPPQRVELLEATDETIEDAVQYADPMVLRGLLYQLTGDESVAATELEVISNGYGEITNVSNPSHVALLRAKAAAFLKAYRDRGAGPLPYGPVERLPRSLGLTAGTDMPETELDLWVEQLALDPGARGLAWQKPPSQAQLENFVVAVIGAGMGGLNAAVHMKRAGIKYFVIEKNDEVGGTWYENKYPGARVDSPSRTYTHIYGVDFEYPNAFCPRAENLRYFKWVAERFGIRPDITFKTEVKSVVWDEAAKQWEIAADGPNGPRVWRANAVIASVGFLSRPNLPSIEGMESFKGPSFHTARWPEDLDPKGKRIGVIGSGASAYQMVPELAKSARHTFLFQRTPNWCFEAPGYLAAFPPQVNWLDRNFPYMTNFIRFRMSLLAHPDNVPRAMHVDPEFQHPHARSARNKRMRDERVAFITRKLADRPDLIEKMIPAAPPNSARPIIVDPEYSIYDAIQRVDVTLVTDPMRRITPNGIEVEGGDEIALDVIVYATGFKANDFLWPMEIRGRGGKRVEELWAKDGARAYLGSMLPDFPNFFMIYGPNTNNFGGLQIVDLHEMTTRFALECIGGLIAREKHTVDVTLDAYWRFNAELDLAEAPMMYKDPRANNYYKNSFGRSATNCPIDVRKMWTWLRDPWRTRPAAGDPAAGDPAAGDPAALASTAVRPYFGEDLIVE
jgi:4-hydroxyacetophenone monooxygenase